MRPRFHAASMSMALIGIAFLSLAEASAPQVAAPFEFEEQLSPSPPSVPREDSIASSSMGKQHRRQKRQEIRFVRRHSPHKYAPHTAFEELHDDQRKSTQANLASSLDHSDKTIDHSAGALPYMSSLLDSPVLRMQLWLVAVLCGALCCCPTIKAYSQC
mmetsp:Transcript_34872/g.55749  ORF Transcript_34872/g.55749 Transcript_34872/m.55749 type:complete len:159 (+) Transcript_34872:47-523(+)